MTDGGFIGVVVRLKARPVLAELNAMLEPSAGMELFELQRAAPRSEADALYCPLASLREGALANDVSEEAAVDLCQEARQWAIVTSFAASIAHFGSRSAADRLATARAIHRRNDARRQRL